MADLWALQTGPHGFRGTAGADGACGSCSDPGLRRMRVQEDGGFGGRGEGRLLHGIAASADEPRLVQELAFHGPCRRDDHVAQEELAKTLIPLKAYSEATIHLEDACAVRKSVDPAADRTIETMRNYAIVLAGTGNDTAALEVYRDIWLTQANKYGTTDPRTCAAALDYMNPLSRVDAHPASLLPKRENEKPRDPSETSERKKEAGDAVHTTRKPKPTLSTDATSADRQPGTTPAVPPTVEFVPGKARSALTSKYGIGASRVALTRRTTKPPADILAVPGAWPKPTATAAEPTQPTPISTAPAPERRITAGRYPWKHQDKDSFAAFLTPATYSDFIYGTTLVPRRGAPMLPDTPPPQASATKEDAPATKSSDSPSANGSGTQKQKPSAMLTEYIKSKAAADANTSAESVDHKGKDQDKHSFAASLTTPNVWDIILNGTTPPSSSLRWLLSIPPPPQASATKEDAPATNSSDSPSTIGSGTQKQKLSAVRVTKNTQANALANANTSAESANHKASSAAPTTQAPEVGHEPTPNSSSATESSASSQPSATNTDKPNYADFLARRLAKTNNLSLTPWYLDVFSPDEFGNRIHPSVSTGNLASHTLLLPKGALNMKTRHARSSSGVQSVSKAEPEATAARPTAREKVYHGKMCDATLSTTKEDPSVDRWFADIEAINTRIFSQFRRRNPKRVKIGILDTGIDMSNPVFQAQEIRRRIKKRVDFLDPEGDATDTCGHGTHCAALIHRVAPAADIYIGRVAQGFESGLDEETVAKVSSQHPFPQTIQARDMAVRTQGGDYHNIVPWKVLDASRSLADIAKNVEWVIKRKFGS